MTRRSSKNPRVTGSAAATATPPSATAAAQSPTGSPLRRSSALMPRSARLQPVLAAKAVSPTAVARFRAASAGPGRTPCTATLCSVTPPTPTASGGIAGCPVTVRGESQWRLQVGRKLVGRVGQPSDLDQLEAQRLDPVEQTVQRGLVLDRTVQHRLDRLDGGRQGPGRAPHGGPPPALDPRLVAVP